MKEIIKIFSLYLLGIILLIACSPVKRVLADIDKVKAVRTATDDLFPCVNDTTVITNTDTLTETVELPGETSYDTTVVNDTVYLTKTVNTESVKTITVYKDKIVKDGRELKRVNEELASAIKAKDIAQAQTIKAQDNEKKASEKARKYFWIIVILSVVSVGSHLIRGKLSKGRKLVNTINPN